jgi:hypothetical protein
MREGSTGPAFRRTSILKPGRPSAGGWARGRARGMEDRGADEDRAPVRFVPRKRARTGPEGRGLRAEQGPGWAFDGRRRRRGQRDRRAPRANHARASGWAFAGFPEGFLRGRVRGQGPGQLKPLEAGGVSRAIGLPADVMRRRTSGQGLPRRGEGPGQRCHEGCGQDRHRATRAKRGHHSPRVGAGWVADVEGMLVRNSKAQDTGTAGHRQGAIRPGERPATTPGGVPG